MTHSSITPVILVTGMSGAGRNFVLKTLEDIGYESVDNLPLSLLRMVIQPTHALSHPLAIGIDVRTRDFSVDSFLEQIERLQSREDIKLEVIFCDCDDETLARRYTETRRRHPLADERPVLDGIKAERTLLTAMRKKATFILDTTSLSVSDTRHIIRHHFPLSQASSLFIQIISFAFRAGIPREADLVFDVRFLRNPYYEKDLAPQTGQQEMVADYIKDDVVFAPFLRSVQEILTLMLSRFDGDGRSYLTIAFGCTGGQHRSVFCAEQLAQWLSGQGRHLAIRHRDMPKLSPAATMRSLPFF